MSNIKSDLQRAFDEGYEKGKADRPQGKWMHDDSSPVAYRCTACNTLQHWSVIQNGRYHFCPNCGADMRKESE